jgi:adenine-specific DNA-methyltransferase
MQESFEIDIPQVRNGERPTEYADRVGTWYVDQCDEAHRKNFGLYLTPHVVANFMVGMLRQRGERQRILDPAAGAGILLCAAIEYLVGLPNVPREIELVAYELDAKLIEPLKRVLQHLKTWAVAYDVSIKSVVHKGDFILTHAQALEGANTEYFDAVIANPPYFKISKDDPRALAARSVVHGQPNIYGLFMAVSMALLDNDGDFIFITPRSFASGTYFRRFRECFFEMARPCYVHVFGSRRVAFSRDDVLQENVIIHAMKDVDWQQREGNPPCMIISTSSGLSDLNRVIKETHRLCDVLDISNSARVLRLPTSSKDADVMRLVDSWSGSIRLYGLEISTGPVVPFRATEWLAEKGNGVTVPLLWMNHVQAMEVHWPNGSRKQQYIVSNGDSRYLLLPNRNYVLLRRFSAKEEKRRLTAAPLLSCNLDTPLVGLENHLNYIYRPGGTLTEDEVWGLAALYNSTLLDVYFRCVNGHTQVNATELRAMPLPPMNVIISIGKKVKAIQNPVPVIDDLVARAVGSSKTRLIYEGAKAVG